MPPKTKRKRLIRASPQPTHTPSTSALNPTPTHPPVSDPSPSSALQPPTSAPTVTSNHASTSALNRTPTRPSTSAHTTSTHSSDSPDTTSTPPPASAATKTTAGNVPRKFWTVSVIDENEVVTEENLKAADVWKLPSEKKVIVPSNRFGQLVGDAAGLLSTWMGDLAANTNAVPVHYIDWRNVPEKYRDFVGDLINGYFHFESERGFELALQSFSKKRKEVRTRLKAKYCKADSTREEVMATVPEGVLQEQWNSLVDYWFSEKAKETCERNKVSRAKQKITHTGGSKSLARRSHEMELQAGRPVSRSELFVVTHKKRDGSFVNEDARLVAEKLQKIMEEEVESGQVNNEIVASENDALGQVLGKSRCGSVRGMGLGACPSTVFGPSSDRGCSSTCECNANASLVRSLQSELSMVKSQLADLRAERAREQAERDRERTRINNVLKQLEDRFGIQPPLEETYTFSDE